MKNNKSTNDPSSKSIYYSILLAGKYLGLGWIMVTPTIILTFIGNFFDNKLNLGYFMTLIGLMIGLFIGIIGTVRILKS
ncbi:MAG: hypothetical protein GWO78_03325 [Dehalococcoidales bacterium]|jgi:hypothetical protein|nr:AtpZ/AtpI family protein [Dehalococcoidia bacterium]NCG35010.1 hypothetical protein [Dehalococcoidales bacterium]